MGSRMEGETVSNTSGGYEEGMKAPTALPIAVQGRKGSWTFHALNVFLRLVTCVAAWIAFYMVLTAKETKTINLGIVQVTQDAKWEYASAFKFHLIANGVVGSYAVLTTLLAILVARTGSKPGSLLWAVFLLDLVMGYLQIAAIGATMAVSFIGKYGNSHTKWMAICGIFTWFCDRMQWALVAAAVAFFTLIESTLVDAFELFKYQIAPSTNNFIVQA